MPIVRRPRLLACALLAAALAGAGCGERSEPVGALAQTYPVSVQGAGDRPTVLKAKPVRIVALDAGSAELLAALGVGKRLVGIPSGVRIARAAGAAETVSGTGQINVAGVIALDPDLVVATSATDQLDLARLERETGAAVYVQPAASILNVEQGAIDLGVLVGAPARARQLVGRIQRRVAAIEARLQSVAPVSVFIDTGFFITVPERSLLGDLVKRAQGKSIAGATPGPGPFPLADLRDANPRVFLATSDSEITLAALQSNPITADVRAVRRKRLLVVPSALVTRAGPRVAAGLEAVARALHPDAFR
ncbi:MAG: ABC transporter substrate-binding protein [Gaiellaceae bacterium]